MAHRIRTIKPEMWSSEDVLSLSLTGQLTWVVLISIADDEGRIKTHARHLHEVYLHKADPDEIRAQLQQMQKQDMILQYRVDGRCYVQIQSWKSHQRVSHPKDSAFPGPDDPRAVPENSGELANLPDWRARAHAYARHAPGVSDPIRTDPNVPDPRAGARGGAEKEPDELEGSTSYPNGASERTANGTNEVSELLAGYQQVTGNEPTNADAMVAGDFVAELGRRLSVSKMVERMRTYTSWCQANGKSHPRSLKRFWDTLRQEADHEADTVAGHANRPSSNGFSSAGDVLARQQEEDPF